MLRDEQKQLQIVVIYVWRGRAYLPTQGQFTSGIFVNIDPVYVVNLNKKDITEAIKAVKDSGYIRLPSPKTREEFRALRDTVIVATGARSWKQLARTGAAYTVGWTGMETRIDMSRLDKKGRWENDPNKVRILPPDTPLEEIVEIILEDIKTRSEVFSNT